MVRLTGRAIALCVSPCPATSHAPGLAGLSAPAVRQRRQREVERPLVGEFLQVSVTMSTILQ